VNFLEVMLYHRTACEGADDTLVELIDYCYRKFSVMVGQCEKLADDQYLFPDDTTQNAKQIMAESKAEEMDKQFKEIEFKTTMSCFSIIRFISDHLETLPVPIVH